MRIGNVGIVGMWTIRESKNGILVRERTYKNIFTNYGLTNLAGYGALPQYLVIEANGIHPSSLINSGVTSISLAARADQSGDTQLVLSPGQASQETVTFSAVSGSGPYTYTLTTATTHSHPTTDYVVRQVNVNDTMSSVVSEQQYDSTNFPGTRVASSGGYSNGNGNSTIQFYFPGSSANILFTTCGLADSQTIGQGNLHNHFVLGFDHTSTGNDLEIDGSLTLSNI